MEKRNGLINKLWNYQISGSNTTFRGFPGDSDDKESACSAEDVGLIPGSGRSSREGNDYPLRYSCLGNPMDRGVRRTTVHGIAKSWIGLSGQHFSLSVPHLPLMLCEICESGNCIMFLLSTLAPSTIPALRRFSLFLLWVFSSVQFSSVQLLSPVQSLSRVRLFASMQHARPPCPS